MQVVPVLDDFLFGFKSASNPDDLYKCHCLVMPLFPLELLEFKSQYMADEKKQCKTEQQPRRFLVFMCGVAKALFQFLASMEALRLLHCDVKPSNILCTQPDDPDAWLDANEIAKHVKVADYGLSIIYPNAKMEDDKAVVHERMLPVQDASHRKGLNLNYLVSTLPYRSPEALFGLWQHLGPATDMWSVGCVLFELWLEGRTPFYTMHEANIVDIWRCNLGELSASLLKRLDRESQCVKMYLPAAATSTSTTASQFDQTQLLKRLKRSLLFDQEDPLCLLFAGLLGDIFIYDPCYRLPAAVALRRIQCIIDLL
jgi:serine/threonine protein kinase